MNVTDIMKICEREENFVMATMPLRDIAGDQFLKKLVDDGFLKAPASIKHHGKHTGGLFDHSFCVAELLCLYTKKLGLKWQRTESPLIVGLFHDLCKMDDYKRDATGAWVKNEDRKPGHGQKSLDMLRGVELTEEEKICIRLHMGPYSEPNERREYGIFCETMPTLLYTNTADMAASHFLNDDPNAVEWGPKA